MVGHQEWIDEESPLSITEQANVQADELYAWVESQTVDEVLELASAFRIPNAPVGNGANVESLDHFQARGSFVANPRDGFVQPGPPYRVQPDSLARAASRRRASANTPTSTAEMDGRVAERPESTPRRTFRSDCRSRGCACST